MTILNNKIVILKGLRPKPKDKIDINSLSFFNFTKHKSNPKIIIKGKMTVIIFGIKYNDRNNISKIST